VTVLNGSLLDQLSISFILFNLLIVLHVGFCFRYSYYVRRCLYITTAIFKCWTINSTI